MILPAASLLTGILLLAVGLAHANTTVTEKWPTGAGTCIDTPLRLTFSSPVHLGGEGKIAVYRVSDHKQIDLLDLGSGDFTDICGGKPVRIDPIVIDGASAIIHLHSHVLGYGEHYVVSIDPKVFRDASDQAVSGLGDKQEWTFAVRDRKPKIEGRSVVAADGTGDFCTVQGALDDLPIPNLRRTIVFVKTGVYDGLIRIGPGLDHISLLGEDRKKTVLTAFNNARLNPSVSARAVISVEAKDFFMENLTVRNRTPYLGSQAEALYVQGDRCILQGDDFYSYQDTLCLNGRIYVSHCHVEGDVDFIWGSGSAFLEDCEINAVHNGFVVQARNPPEHPGYIFSKCRLTFAEDAKRCWLARIAPETFPASQATFLHCAMGPGIVPEGWKLEAPKGKIEASVRAGAELRFEEYQNTDLQGRPLDISHRLAGSRQLNDAEAAAVSEPAKVFGGKDQWNPLAAVTTL